MEVLMNKLQEDISKRSLPSLLARTFVNTAEENGQQKLRIMQWNILAQALTQGDDNFILCPPAALQWDNRQLRVIEELVRFSPNIMCLQEVDMFQFLKDTLGQVGYEGIFTPKPSSPCTKFQNNMGSDGCAVFYQTDKLELLSHDSINLREKDEEETNQVAILCKFRLKSNQKVFYVSVCHLKAKSGYADLRHQQGKYLLKVLKKKVEAYPVLICGDFNAHPKEPVYAEFIKSDLGVTSAYSHLSTKGEEPNYTSWKIRGTPDGQKTESCKTIDYIWYSTDKASVAAVLDLPLPEAIGEARLPSFTYPSDHFSLVSDVVLNK
ncbi:nocturnin-like [Mizuhopecten yessoensis]|uniref:Nocturnin n=1 Tax=Mizuhopecten yessoensis TaxID=6573 RepID=A0A210QFV4_MIZYE|nr:nocturnin-like [Mizuhopecten yessoensis]OWF47637.1 Nocturnin [Mizuhopecten yessoensis]